MSRRPKLCTLAPVPPGLAALLTRADAHAVGALAASGDVARRRYEDGRAWTWGLLARCGVAVERVEPVAAATPHDVMTDAAALFLAVPIGRDDCGACRACTDALGVEKAAHSYAHAVRTAWCDLTGRARW